MVDAEDGGPGGFDAGGVFAGGFAEFCGALGHVEDVVDDLKGEAGLFAEGAETGDGVRVALECGWAARDGRARLSVPVPGLRLEGAMAGLRPRVLRRRCWW